MDSKTPKLGNPNPNLPDEILIGIFSRLPVKSVGRCRCLSKSWRRNLSTSQFVNSHLSRKTDDKKDAILLARATKLYTLRAPVDDGNDDAWISNRLELPDLYVEAVLGSCNGLALVLSKEGEILVLNPLTLQKVTIQDAPQFQPSITYGFGYDSCSNDYKIVKLSNVSGGTFVHLYSLKNNVWKSVNISHYYCYNDDDNNPVFVDGAIHWIATSRDDRYVIAAFDLATESFHVIPIPDEYSNSQGWVFCEPYRLFGIRGWLFLVDPDDFTSGDVCILKRYGQVNSWTKCTRNTACGRLGSAEPLCAIGEDEVVFLPAGLRNLIVWNLTDGTTKDVNVTSALTYIRNGCAFVDSLVSPIQCGVPS